MPRQLFDYIDGGAYRETTMGANVDDLRKVRLRQRILREEMKVAMALTGHERVHQLGPEVFDLS